MYAKLFKLMFDSSTTMIPGLFARAKQVVLLFVTVLSSSQFNHVHILCFLVKCSALMLGHPVQLCLDAPGLTHEMPLMVASAVPGLKPSNQNGSVRCHMSVFHVDASKHLQNRKILLDNFWKTTRWTPISYKWSYNPLSVGFKLHLYIYRGCNPA